MERGSRYGLETAGAAAEVIIRSISGGRSPSLRLERPAHLFGKQLWLFEGRKMPPFVELVPIEQVRPKSLGPLAGRTEDFARKNGSGHRQIDAPG